MDDEGNVGSAGKLPIPCRIPGWGSRIETEMSLGQKSRVRCVDHMCWAVSALLSVGAVSASYLIISPTLKVSRFIHMSLMMPYRRLKVARRTTVQVKCRVAVTVAHVEERLTAG
jgi:hypothetical protein